MNIAQRLHEVDLFKEVHLEDLEALSERMKPEHFDRGQVLFSANDIGDTMYFIQKGRIRIYMQDEDGEELTLTHYGVNEIFGELSPIDGLPRSASAAAVEDLEVLALHREDFLDFLDERPQIGLAMMRSLSERLRNTTTYLEEYRPTRFEAPVADQGEMLRRGARGMAGDILDELREAKTRDKIVVPSDFKAQNAAEPPAEDSTSGSLYANLSKRSEDGEGENTSKGAGGIFDLLAKATEEKDDDEKSSE